MDTSPHKSDFVNVNGINLHYLDWGGEGDVLLFLTGMGCSAHLFDHIAPRFTDSFRVLALTRRGQGESDYPETGYDADTLIEDIRLFMDHLNINKAILAGHSMAGIELNHFASTYPNRVVKLIYLDANDDFSDFPAVMEQNPLKDIEPPKPEKEPTSIEEYIANFKANYPIFADIWSNLWDLEISYEVKANENGVFVDKMSEAISGLMFDTIYKHVPAEIPENIPILRFTAQGFNRSPDYYSNEQKAMDYQFYKEVYSPFIKSLISKFQKKYPHAQIVEIPDGHHYCFIAQEELVFDEMKKFLVD